MATEANQQPESAKEIRLSDDDAHAKWPQLPEKPDGWTQRAVMFLDGEDKGGRWGSGVYEIMDPDGAIMPFAKSYCTSKINGHKGFDYDGNKFESWSALRDAWASRTTPKGGA